LALSISLGKRGRRRRRVLWYRRSRRQDREALSSRWLRSCHSRPPQGTASRPCWSNPSAVSFRAGGRYGGKSVRDRFRGWRLFWQTLAADDEPRLGFGQVLTT